MPLSRAFALAPPSQSQLCRVVGTVLEVGTDDQGHYPTVKLKLSEGGPSEIREAGFLDCTALKAGQTRAFRNCRGIEFQIGEKFEGIAGRSLGGGLHCLDRK